MDEGPSVPINSVKRSYLLLDELRMRGRAGATELADALELPKSTVHNHLLTLAKLGYLVGEEGSYRLGARYLHLGQESRNSRAVFRHGRDAAETLAEQSEKYCQLAIEENGDVAVIQSTQWIPDNGTRPSQQPYPMRAHLHTNALGKAILAHLPPERITEIIDQRGLTAQTELTVTDEDNLRTEIETIRDRGYAVDRGELIRGMVGVAAPIVTDQTVHGAVAAYGAGNEMEEALDEGLPDLVTETADDIRADIVFARPD
ncbi:IclR family transcriptional regulator [Natronorubrum halophilum]|uniref:IclR family transcriptional regulator n=1 Tax=Natronorubrum halophilum TaxID=1702106 RepID=UPI0014852FFE|nr:IclR family transcriptional regulator [Natronorubrum halophilum]